MMSNYDRTLELVDAAYNSSGASQEQFSKTLESLDSKLNQLKNAWDSFVMTISNSTIVKAVVDILTDLLTVINNITSQAGALGGVINTLLMLGGLKLGFNVLGSFFQTFKDANGKSSLLNFSFKGFFENLKKAFSRGKQESSIGEEEKRVGREQPENIKTGMEETASEAYASAENIGTKVGESLANALRGQKGNVEEAAAELTQAANGNSQSQNSNKLGIQADNIGDARLVALGLRDKQNNDKSTKGKSSGAVIEINDDGSASVFTSRNQYDKLQRKAGSSKRYKNNSDNLEYFDYAEYEKQQQLLKEQTKDRNTTTNSDVSMYNTHGFTSAEEIKQQTSNLNEYKETLEATKQEESKRQQEIENSTNTTRKAVASTGAGLLAFSGILMGVNTVLQETGKISDEDSESLSTLTTIAMALGGALEGVATIGTLFKDLELGEKLSSLKDLVKSGGLLSTLSAKLTSVLGSFSALIAPLGALAVAFGLAYGAFRLFGDDTEQFINTGSLDKLNYQANKAAESVDNVTESYNNLTSALTSYESAREALENIDDTSSTEYLQQQIELNNSTKELINLYPELANGLTTVNGVLTINRDVMAEVVEKQQEMLASSNSELLAANYREAVGQLDNYTQRLSTNGNLVQNGEISQTVAINRSQKTDFYTNHQGLIEELRANKELIQSYEDLADSEQLASKMSSKDIQKAQQLLEKVNKTASENRDELGDKSEYDLLLELSLDDDSYEQVQSDLADLSELELQVKINREQIISDITGADNFDSVLDQELAKQYLSDTDNYETMINEAQTLANDIVKNDIQKAYQLYAQSHSDTAWYDSTDKTLKKVSDNEQTSTPFSISKENLATGIESSQYQVATKALMNTTSLSADKIDSIMNSVSGATEEFEKLKESELGAKLQLDGLSETDAELMLKRLAIQVAESNQKFVTLNDTIIENQNVLKNQRGTVAYDKAISSIVTSAKAAFNGSERITDTFVRNNIDAFMDYANGSEEALEQIRSALKEDLIVDLKLNKDDLSEEEQTILNFINGLDNLEFDINGNATLDYTDVLAALTLMGWSLDDFCEKIEGTGYSISWENDGDETLTIPAQSIGQYKSSLSHEEQIDASFAKAFGGTYGNITFSGGQFTLPKKKMVINKTGSGTAGKTSSNSSPSYSPSGSDSGSGGGSGSDSSENTEKWKNSYDKFYNTLEKINEAIRQREKLERNYDRILKKRNATLSELRANMKAQLDTLRQEQSYQSQLASGYLSQIQNIGNETYIDDDGNRSTYAGQGVTGYASYNASTGLISIDWDAINAITNDAKGSAVEDYISRLEELVEQYEEAQDTIDEIEDDVQELIEQNKEAYLDLEQRVYDALVQQEQDRIDAYQTLADTINDSNSRILDSLQESIDLERQIRDNTETEEDIADKEARLAYLKRDTSGANQLEIKQLEEELEDARESYTDTLVDQAIEKLSNDNDKASEQRELQIEIMQAILDRNTENGYYWSQVSDLLSSAFNSDGSLNNNSALVELLKNTESFKGMSEFGGMNWISELVSDFVSSMEGYGAWMVEKAKDAGTLTLSNGTTLSYDSTNSQWKDNSGNIYKDLGYNALTNQYEYGDIEAAVKQQVAAATSSSSSSARSYPYGKASETTGNVGWGEISSDVKAIQWALQQMGYDLGPTGVDGDFGNYTYNAVRAFQSNSGAEVDGIVGVETRGKFAMYGYKTGGLASQTGLAWLDGTPEKPELVLNAEDTQNFLALTNLLRTMQLSSSAIGNNTSSSGDNYYSFNIEVEQLADNYDVDQLATKIEDIITEKSMYRNVNAIRFIR